MEAKEAFLSIFIGTVYEPNNTPSNSNDKNNVRQNEQTCKETKMKQTQTKPDVLDLLIDSFFSILHRMAMWLHENEPNNLKHWRA